MAVLTVQEITRAGFTSAAVAAAAGGDQFLPSRDTFLRVGNGGGGSITVTVTTPGTAIGLGLADVVVAIGAGVTKEIGPFPAEHFADPTDGLADISYTGVTSVTVSTYSVARP